MKRKINWLVCFISIALFSLAACIMGDSFTAVKGKVLDEKGKPIKGAKVILVVGIVADEGESREDGSYNLLVSHASTTDKPKLTVTKEGYETYQKQFNSREELGAQQDEEISRQRDIVLKLSSSSKAQPN